MFDNECVLVNKSSTFNIYYSLNYWWIYCDPINDHVVKCFKWQRQRSGGPVVGGGGGLLANVDADV